MRTGIHSIVRHEVGVSADKRAVNDFVKEFWVLVQAEGFVSQQVFYCDETSLL